MLIESGSNVNFNNQVEGWLKAQIHCDLKLILHCQNWLSFVAKNLSISTIFEQERYTKSIGKCQRRTPMGTKGQIFLLAQSGLKTA